MTSNAKFRGLFELDPATVRCPYAVYDQMRSEPPEWIEAVGAYAVTRHEDVAAILRDTVRFSSRFQSGPSSVTPLAERLSKSEDTPDTLLRQVLRRLEISKSPVLVNCDPPGHVRQRRLVNKAFTPRRVALLEPRVQEITDRLIDAFARDGKVELVNQFCVNMTITVIAEILGVPASMMDTFKNWSDAFTVGTGRRDLSVAELEDMFGHVDAFYDYFTEQIADRRDSPRDDLLTDLVNARSTDDEPLTDHEILQMLVQFLVAGNETTTNLIGMLVHALVTDHALMERIRADSDLIRPLVEETLRLESPVQGLYRTANVDVEIGGTAIPAGGTIWIVFGAANRDETVFNSADAIDLDNADQRHLAFGKGEHFCLGAPIARLEARIAVETLLRRFPDLALACEPEGVEFLPNFVIHGLASLPLTFSKERNSHRETVH